MQPSWGSESPLDSSRGTQLVWRVGGCKKSAGFINCRFFLIHKGFWNITLTDKKAPPVLTNSFFFVNERLVYQDLYKIIEYRAQLTNLTVVGTEMIIIKVKFDLNRVF